MNVLWRKSLASYDYLATVTRTGHYTGRLELKNSVTRRKIIDKEVPLSYGAIFGPDLGDVQDWLEDCEEALAQLKRPSADDEGHAVSGH